VLRKGLLHSYSARLATLAERTRADAAVLEAHREHALAELSRIDMLKAQARDPAKSEFFSHMLVAHMSHELRTPLNAIIGFSDMIRLTLKKMPEDGKLLGYADDINSAGWHLLRVINDILDLSKVEAGKLDLNEEEFDFPIAAEACARMIRGQMEEKTISFLTEIPSSLPKLRADDLKLKQVLINLLSNAAKFTPPQGHVTLRAELQANGAFVIEVADTGIGIDAQDIAKVFTPFTQLNANVSRNIQGTGLGLPLARALIQLHGGTLTLASEKGVGTTATVRLPASRVVPATPARKNGHARPDAVGTMGAAL
jgi:signal transduction histidine kinase